MCTMELLLGDQNTNKIFLRLANIGSWLLPHARHPAPDICYGGHLHSILWQMLRMSSGMQAFLPCAAARLSCTSPWEP